MLVELHGILSNLQLILSKGSRILQSIHPTFYTFVSSLNTFTESRISVIQHRLGSIGFEFARVGERVGKGGV